MNIRKGKALLFLALLLALAGVHAAGARASGEDYEAMGRDMVELNKQRKYQDVIDTYERYATPENQNHLFYVELGMAYFRLEVLRRKAKEEPDWSRADNYLTIAHKLKPDQLYVIFQLAVLNTYTKDYQKAHHFANMYLEKGGESRKKDAETILEKYDYFVIEQKSPEPIPGTEDVSVPGLR